MNPEELAKEREAFLERRRKEDEARMAARPAPEDPTKKRGLSRADRIKLRDDEYVPPTA